MHSIQAPSDSPAVLTARARVALTSLHRDGAHLVLVSPDCKKSFGKWRHRRPNLVTLLTHPGPIGIVPHSVGLTALDVDRGGLGLQRAFVQIARPALSLPSRRPGRRHWYWHDDQPRRNCLWGAGRPCLRRGCGCRQSGLWEGPLGGEVRGASGYLICWSGRWDAVLEAAEGEPHPFGPVAELLDLAESDQRRGAPPATPDAGLQLRLDDDLALTPIGARNITLFEALRYWSWPRRSDLTVERSVDVAQAMAAQMRTPLPVAEVVDTARSVATYTISRSGVPDRDVSSEAQARRGRLSGIARRGPHADRDAAILSDRQQGMSQRRLADKYGLSRGGVEWVLERSQ